MEIKTKVISKETIKPSTPTPKSLQRHQLSFLDHGAPPIFAPMVYFYSSDPQISNSQKSNHLKNSLSETLSRFYPLAGRLVDNLYVDCNDRGAPFADAEANCNLSQVITNPEPERIKKLFLYKFDESQDNFCMAVQATYFLCGGLAVGLLISHKIADAISIVTFANSWSAVARNGGGGLPSPKFDAATYFPPRDISRFNPSVGITQEEVATRIFTFPAAKINALRERYAAPSAAGDQPRRLPSRVDALSVYLWTRFLLATRTQADPTKIYSMKHAVNLRGRVDPPMSEYNFGNINWLSIAKPAAGDGGAELLHKIREAKKALYDGYATELKELNAMTELMSQAEAGERVTSFIYTSLCGFPMYEADFGWGRPAWVVSPGFPHKNVAIFMDAKTGGGIEVLIHLTKQHMEKFEADLELLKSNL